eukprot:Skav227730  [mRNA]  locus=scaffold5201:11290:12079:- [translate_table: standard]
MAGDPIWLVQRQHVAGSRKVARAWRQDSDLHLNQSQIDKLFNGVVLAIASEAERKNQNLLGRKVLRLLRKSALDAFKVKNPSPRYFELPWRGFSWVEEDTLEQARASMALPITGGSILVLALVSLNFFHRTFSRSKDYQAPGSGAQRS